MSYRVNSVLTMLKTILPSLPRAVKIEREETYRHIHKRLLYLVSIWMRSGSTGKESASSVLADVLRALLTGAGVLSTAVDIISSGGLG